MAEDRERRLSSPLGLEEACNTAAPSGEGFVPDLLMRSSPAQRLTRSEGMGKGEERGGEEGEEDGDGE